MRRKRIIASLLSVLVVTSLLGNQAAASISIKDVYRDDTDLLIEDMLVSYGYYGEEADDYVDQLLEEIGDEDPDRYARWEMIMSEWSDVYDGVEVNLNELPDGLTDGDNLCIVVLGFQLNPDGSMREELIERLNVALTCAEQYPNAYIACTGGGTAANDEDATEAGRMAEWLIEHGVDSDRVIVEDRSQTTAQNAMFTLRILSRDYPEVDQIAIVSSDYHIATGEILFEAQSVLMARDVDDLPFEVVSNAAYEAPSGTLTSMFQAGALIELSGNMRTAYDIYCSNYDIHELPEVE